MFAGYWLLAVLVLVALAVHVRRQPKDAALAAGVALVVYTHSASWAGIDLLGIPRFVQYDFGWTRAAIVWHLVATTVFGFALTLVLVRRLVRDREEKLRLSGEFEAARTVQQMLLSHQSGQSPNFRAEFVYKPAQETGGDFYWSRTSADGALLVAVGDVSGKGLKAAMLVSVVTGILRNERTTSPAAVLKALNEALTGQMSGGFVTCCCARFDPDGRVIIASAGHPGPYSNGVETQVDGGLPLGVAEGMEYVESVATGERFTFVSDGVLEAANSAGELFGFERTRAISGKGAEEIAAAARSWGQNDDITVVTVQRSAA
jgi:serine phosphatase RsbU (regulator of sigma subunit)